MASKKKKVEPAPAPEPTPEPILIVDNTPEPAPAPAPRPDRFKEDPKPRSKHPCSKCGTQVEVFETVCSQTAKGYCSTNCYIAR